MARRKAESGQQSDRLSPEVRFRVLATLLMASEPGSPAAAVSARILKRAGQIRGTGEGAVSELREFIASLGLEDAADRALAAKARRT